MTIGKTKRFALCVLLRRPLPKDFSLDDETAIREKYNVFGVRGRVGDVDDVLLRNFQDDNVEYKYWAPGVSSQDGVGKIDEIDWGSLEVVQMFRSREIRYDTVWGAVFNSALKIDWIQWQVYRLRNKDFQYFNERMHLLHVIVRRWRDTREVKKEYLLTEIYNRWVQTEHLYAAQNDLQFLLEALIESGDITLDDDVLSDVKPSAKALNTLAEYETAKMRHEDASRLSFYQLAVTIALVLVALATFIRPWLNLPL